VSQGSSEPDGVSYGIRYSGAQTRFLERLAAIEQRVALQGQELAALRTEQSVIKVNFEKHADRQADDAKGASADSKKTLDEVRALREDIAVMKAQKGTVQVEAVQRVIALCGGLVVLVASAAGAIIWVAERAS